MSTCCIILNYNDSETTLTLLRQIKNHRDLDYIVIVDNLSTDNSYEVIKKFKSNRIHVLLAEYNGGYGYGNNLGIRYSYEQLNADYILIANPDVAFSNECVIELRKILQEDKKCAISAAVPLKPNGRRQKVIAWKLPKLKEEIISASMILSRLAGLEIRYDYKEFSNKKKAYVDVVQGSMLMLDAKIMIKYGMYDEEFFLYYEEQVLAQKMKKHNFKSVLLLNQSYIHNHSVSITKSYKSIVKRRKLLLDSKLLYLKKYHNLHGIKLSLTKIFFFLTLGETWLISIINNFRRKKDI
ncbi:glycosyltransferase [Siminovitchia fortis]|uniref:glycosyltransferase n=1 Tax=Siminovitchia fortis TaxID=254758 RepID=UPI0011AA069C|nr:glycosyltransferase [Siminovitchia fortis]